MIIFRHKIRKVKGYRVVIISVMLNYSDNEGQTIRKVRHIFQIQIRNKYIWGEKQKLLRSIVNKKFYSTCNEYQQSI